MADMPSDPNFFLARITRPLSWIFWGVLLIFVDFRIGLRIDDRIVNIDVLPNTLGLALLSLGLAVLAFGDHLEGAIDLIATATAIYFLGLLALSVISWFDPRLQEPPWFVSVILRATTTAAMVALCYAFRAIALRLALSREARLWLLSGALAIFFYPLPQALATTPIVRTAAFPQISALANLIPTAAFLVSLHRLRRTAPSQHLRRGAI